MKYTYKFNKEKHVGYGVYSSDANAENGGTCYFVSKVSHITITDILNKTEDELKEIFYPKE